MAKKSNISIAADKTINQAIAGVIAGWMFIYFIEPETIAINKFVMLCLILGIGFLINLWYEKYS